MLASAGMALLLGSLQQPERQRTILPNGVRLQVEATAHPDRAAVALAVSLAGLSQDDLKQGKVHLLEHLVARGPNRDLDHKLEEQGMSLSVWTTRESMIFRVTCRPRQVSFALESLATLTQPLKVTEADITKEVSIMEEERVLMEGTQKMARAAWGRVFKEEAVDPMGFPEPGQVTPDALVSLHSRMFEGKAMSIAIAGGVEPSVVTTRAEGSFSKVSAGKDREVPVRSAQFAPGLIVASGMRGAARAALIEGIDSTSGLATVGAALASSRWLGEASPFFTPSLWRSLIYITAPNPDVFRKLDAMTSPEKQSLHSLARISLDGWFNGFKSSPENLVTVQSSLALQNPSLTLDRLQEMAKGITPQQVEAGIDAFTSARALRLESGQ